MNILQTFWLKICVPLDGFLWHRNISHPVIRPVLRNQILATCAAILAGTALWAAFPWLFWFGAGLAIMTWIMWSWARFFGSVQLSEYSAAFLRAVLLQFGLRFLILAALFLFIFAVLHASIIALTAGLVAGGLLALTGFFYNN